MKTTSRRPVRVQDGPFVQYVTTTRIRPEQVTDLFQTLATGTTPAPEPVKTHVNSFREDLSHVTGDDVLSAIGLLVVLFLLYGVLPLLLS